jgi:hypothetical protein
MRVPESLYPGRMNTTWYGPKKINDKMFDLKKKDIRLF